MLPLVGMARYALPASSINTDQVSTRHHSVARGAGLCRVASVSCQLISRRILSAVTALPAGKFDISHDTEGNLIRDTSV